MKKNWLSQSPTFKLLGIAICNRKNRVYINCWGDLQRCMFHFDATNGNFCVFRNSSRNSCGVCELGICVGRVFHPRIHGDQRGPPQWGWHLGGPFRFPWNRTGCKNGCFSFQDMFPILGFLWVNFFTDWTMVNHHQTTIWENLGEYEYVLLFPSIESKKISKSKNWGRKSSLHCVNSWTVRAQFTFYCKCSLKARWRFLANLW